MESWEAIRRSLVSRDIGEEKGAQDIKVKTFVQKAGVFLSQGSHIDVSARCFKFQRRKGKIKMLIKGR